ncbi:hypothetical protein CCH79_00017293 [Gambusia affinis]|uniref:Cadherin domain-containing protein n=1 Tax=Gambusia affinis TaxID=33528 RepID=A0A315VSY3_GAMAF|nr:hypothetical protein CCH79_00017293 [Gambusia affinis]
MLTLRCSSTLEQKEREGRQAANGTRIDPEMFMKSDPDGFQHGELEKVVFSVKSHQSLRCCDWNEHKVTVETEAPFQQEDLPFWSFDIEECDPPVNLNFINASPAGGTEDEICEPGFDSESVIFKVTEKRLRPTTILGKVNFTDCTDVTRLFITTDPYFYVETDGTVRVSRWLVLQEGQRRFFIHSWDSKGKKRTVSAVVQYQRDHDAAHGLQSDFPLKDITNNLEAILRRKRSLLFNTISIVENSRGPFPLRVAQIRSDADRTAKIRYSISGPGADQHPVGLFTMNRDTGHLYVTQGLDRETKDTYEVQAVVDGSAPAEAPELIVVKVIDQNDNKPVFTFLGNVAESSPIGSEVIKVTATDADEPNSDNSRISYRIVSQEPQQPNPSMFVINPATGAISVNAAGLDRQKYPEYTLEVEAADMNGQGHSALTKVIISVTPGTELPAAQGGGRSRRDADPEIHHSSSEKMFLDLLLLPVRSDRSEVTKIIYKLRGPGADQPPVGLFIIDSDSGWLAVTQTLDRENQHKYTSSCKTVVSMGERTATRCLPASPNSRTGSRVGPRRESVNTDCTDSSDHEGSYEGPDRDQ